MSRDSRDEVTDLLRVRPDGKTALEVALIGKDTYMISDELKAFAKGYITSSDFDINSVINPATGETLLHALVKLYNIQDLVQELLTRGARYDIPDSDEKTALEVALIGKDGYISDGGQVLVKTYMDRSDFAVNAVINPATGSTLLHALVNLNRSEDLVQELLTRGARYDIPDSDRKTALEVALIGRDGYITRGGKAFVKAYMTHPDFALNAVINAATGSTLLHALMKLNYTQDLVQELVTRGARYDIPDSQRQTALEVALIQRVFISDSGKAFVKAYMARPDFNPDAIVKPSTRETLLHALMKHNYTQDLVQELVTRGARYDIPDSEGKTALDLALRRVFISDSGKAFVKACMARPDFNPDAIVKPSTRETLLHALMKHNYIQDLVQELVTRGARYDIPDSEGKTALDLAIGSEMRFFTEGGIDLVKAYMARPDFNPDAIVKPSTRETLLHALIKLGGTEDLVQELVTRGARCDIPDSDGKTVLDIVLIGKDGYITRGGKAFVKACMARPDFNLDAIVKPSTGETLLHALMKHNYTQDLVRDLIVRGVRCDIPDSQRQTALEVAIIQRIFINDRGKAIVKSYMTRPDFNINAVINPATGSTLLHALMKHNYTQDLVQELLANGARCDIPDIAGKTALEVALTPDAYKYSGKALLKAYMSRSDVDVNAVINVTTGETLLHALVKVDGREDLVQQLLAKGARYDIPDLEGKTVLDIELIQRAFISDSGKAIVKSYMARSDFNINAVINPATGSTLLHALMKLGRTEDLVQELLAKGARYDIPDSEGKTAFDIAVTLCYIVTEKLTKSGIEIIKKYLSQESVDVNAVIKPATGETLLHALVKLGGTEDLVRDLMVRGARCDIRDSEGKTVLDIELIGGRGYISDGGKALVKAYMARPDFNPDAIVKSSTETLLHALIKLYYTEDLVRDLLTRGARYDIPDSDGKTALDIVLSQQSEGKIRESGRELLAFKTQQDVLASASASAVPASELPEGKEDGDGPDGTDLQGSAAAAAGSREIAGDGPDYGADL